LAPPVATSIADRERLASDDDSLHATNGKSPSPRDSLKTAPPAATSIADRERVARNDDSLHATNGKSPSPEDRLKRRRG
jgi:hypothetical protein